MWPQNFDEVVTYLAWLIKFDGYIDDKGCRVELYDVSQVFLNNLGIKCNISIDKRYHVYRLRISSQNSILRFIRLIGLRHPKFNKILSLISQNPYHHGP